ncbi:MAG: hypothetical protein OXC62_12310 [Aestuariivita sp.]|nr:hypothetical protein [Aestuariivita sp.]
MKVVRRFNVLYLMTVAYVVLVILFSVLALSDQLTASQAWDALEAPLMALIGGTLAISKDLISSDKLGGDNPDNFENKKSESGNEKRAGEKQEQ